MEWRGSKVVGITIGNWQARAAIFEHGQAQLVPLEEGERAMPSAVLLHRLREVGKYAYLYSGTEPKLLVSSINRLLGRNYADSELELRNLPFETRNERNCVRIVDWLGGLYSPIDLYAMMLRKLQQATERYLGGAVAHAVIAVPGSFDDFQRRSVRVAAESVFRYVKLINEPTAAALAMSETNGLPLGHHLMTFDMGAGKCEVAIIQRTRQDHLRIKAITGDTHLGGDDIDKLIFDKLAKKFQREQNEPMIGESAMARHEVMMAVRAAKHQLETASQASVSVPFVNFDRFGKPLHLCSTIKLTEVGELCAGIQQRAFDLIKRCWADAGTPRLNESFLLGGSTRLPFIASMVKRFTKQQATRAQNPDEMAVLGASLYGAQLAGERQGIEIEDVAAHSLGITTHTGTMGFVLMRQSLVPATVMRRFVTVEDNQQEVHIEVREGEHRLANGNRVLGEFWLPLPPRLPRSSPINITIGKDEDGIVLVRAQDLAAGTTREITITYDL